MSGLGDEMNWENGVAVNVVKEVISHIFLSGLY